MILGDKSDHKHVLKINSIKVEASYDVELLGVTSDKKLTFKTQYKLHALRRIRMFPTKGKAKILGKAFIDSQFNYVPLLWMFCRKILKNRENPS